MAWLKRMVCCLTACAASVLVASGQGVPAKPKAKVEFRWVASEIIPGVTEGKGLRMSERDEWFYLYKKAILTSDDVAKVRVSKTTFNAAGPDPKDYFMVYFDLTAEAKAKLAADCGDSGTGLLVAIVDGRSRGTAFFQKAMMNTFVPFSGFYESQSEVDRIVEVFK